MQIVYACINLALLVGLIWLVGRKAIASIFSSRRERIDRELNEAAAPIELAPLPEEVFPAEPELAPVSLGADDPEGLRGRFEHDRDDQRREMLLRTRSVLIGQILEKAGAHMTSREYQDALRAEERTTAENILKWVELTNGDKSYLVHKNVLYVSLISAFPPEPSIVALVKERVTALVAEVGGEVSFRTVEDPSLLGGMQLRIGDTVYDYTVSNKLYRLGRELNSRPMTETDEETLLTGLQSSIEDMDLGIDVFQVGRVLSVSDGICWLDGLSDIMYGEEVEFENGERGMVMDIQRDRVGCIIFGRYEHIESYSRVRRLNVMTSVPVGDALLGRVVDALGNPIDGKGHIWNTETRPIEHAAPPIPERKSVSVPLHTGIKAIDALVPIGRGQRELIIGDRQTGKTAVLVDTILAQKGTGVRCVYVAVGQKRATVAEMAERLESLGAMEYTTIVCATASDSASLQYIAPFAGAAMSEYYMYNGQDALVIYDDLSKHAVAYRELSLLLHRPSGREAYPGDIFYLHSRLLERAARLAPEYGGGSVTALPVIETQAGDISAYIPTNVISITDGQIFLESDLFNEGQRPAVNVGLSVSRVGGAAQTKLMKQVASHLRTSLAQYRELAAFTQFGSELDAATRRVLASGERMMAALRQSRYDPLPDWKQALLIYAVSNGTADNTEPDDMEQFSSALYAWFEQHEPELVTILAGGAKLSDETESRLKTALSAFAEAL